MKNLNVGCGEDVRKGWINLDQHKKNGANCIFDLNEIYRGNKMPFEDNSLDYVYCSHVLEDFINPVPIIDELIRITKFGGKIEIVVPHNTAIERNIYHQRGFSMMSLKQLASGGVDELYGETRPLKVIHSDYHISKSNRIIMKIYKKFYISPYNSLPEYICERTFFKYLFPHKFLRIIFVKKSYNINKASLEGKNE